jgi:hypothetical protein
MMRFAVLVFSLPAAAAQFIGAIGIAPLPVERAPAPCVEDINADGSVDGNSRHIVAVEILSRV